jgi:hypothetical protein
MLCIRRAEDDSEQVLQFFARHRVLFMVLVSLSNRGVFRNAEMLALALVLPRSLLLVKYLDLWSLTDKTNISCKALQA